MGHRSERQNTRRASQRRQGLSARLPPLRFRAPVHVHYGRRSRHGSHHCRHVRLASRAFVDHHWRHLLRRRPGLHGSLRLRQERRQVHGHDHRAVRRPLRPPALPRLLLALHASRHRRLRRHDRRNVQRLHKDRRTEHAQRCRRLDLHDLHRRRRDLRPLPEVRQALERPAARRRHRHDGRHARHGHRLADLRRCRHLARRGLPLRLRRFRDADVDPQAAA